MNDIEVRVPQRQPVKKRIWYVRRWRAALGCTALLACVEFKAVTATSQMGESLVDYKEELGLFDHTCALVRAAGAGTQCPKSTDKWQKALDMLVAYSKQLDAAANQKAPDIHDEISKAIAQTNKTGWTSLSSDANENISKVATAIAAFLSREATRAAVQQAIRDVGPSLKVVVDLLVGHLKAEREYLDILRCTVACSMGAPRDAAACPPPVTCTGTDASTNVVLGDLEQRLDAQDTAVGRAIVAVTAFGKAHDELFAHVEKLDSAQLYKAVIEDIGFAMAAADGGTHD